MLIILRGNQLNATGVLCEVLSETKARYEIKIIKSPRRDRGGFEDRVIYAKTGTYVNRSDVALEDCTIEQYDQLLTAIAHKKTRQQQAAREIDEEYVQTVRTIFGRNLS